ncbi:unnamed protein product [Soboliphyme baturini]|uniref:Uncharacterized protein n=1 Tax=Soboliphyme baturini TaxID=241478 RepID=A0A183IY27_9BILA|nr:unnamed protein product [Soboliphyme baturini]
MTIARPRVTPSASRRAQSPAGPSGPSVGYEQSSWKMDRALGAKTNERAESSPIGRTPGFKGELQTAKHCCESQCDQFASN